MGLENVCWIFSWIQKSVFFFNDLKAYGLNEAPTFLYDFDGYAPPPHCCYVLIIISSDVMFRFLYFEVISPPPP